MVTTVGSPAGDAFALDKYISNTVAHDADSEHGYGKRFEYESTIGDCSPETFIDDMRRTRGAFGKTGLAVETYHYILSHTNEEADPNNAYAGWIAHELARTWGAESFPGHQIKFTTQRDNGRWEEAPDHPDGKVWIPGKWHTHIQVANVAEAAATPTMTPTWTDRDGVEHPREYAAGRAIDGHLKAIHRLRDITDKIVLRDLQYDNEAFMESRRQAEKITMQDYSARGARGYGSWDELRATLRGTRAQATDWSDYVTRLQVEGVEVRVRGASGVSYGWTDEAGVDHSDRARKIGNDYTMKQVEAQCEINAARVAAGEVLEAPERVLAPPSAPAGTLPGPVYLTDDGAPPWASDAALAAYAETVEASGGTYEAKMREGIDEAMADTFVTDLARLRMVAADDHGVELDDADGTLVVKLDGVAVEAARLGANYEGVELQAILAAAEAALDEKELDNVGDESGAHRALAGGAPGAAGGTAAAAGDLGAGAGIPAAAAGDGVGGGTASGAGDVAGGAREDRAPGERIRPDRPTLVAPDALIAQLDREGAFAKKQEVRAVEREAVRKERTAQREEQVAVKKAVKLAEISPAAGVVFAFMLYLQQQKAREEFLVWREEQRGVLEARTHRELLPPQLQPLGDDAVRYLEKLGAQRGTHEVEAYQQFAAKWSEARYVKYRNRKMLANKEPLSKEDWLTWTQGDEDARTAMGWGAKPKAKPRGGSGNPQKAKAPPREYGD